MSIKLLQITAAYKPAYIYGGPTMSVSKLCEALTTTEIEIEVLTTSANGKDELNVRPGEATEVDGVKTTYFNRLTKDHTHFSPALLLALRKKIKEQRVRNKKQGVSKQLPNQPANQLIIHIHAWWNLVSIFSCWIAKWYAIPVILSPRGMLTSYTSSNRNGGFKALIHMLMGKKLLEYCHMHATSEKEKEDILSIVQPKSITVIHNLVNLPSITNDQPSIINSLTNNEQPKTKNQKRTAEAFKLIFLSRIEEKKGLELLFDALVNLPFAWELTIAGSGEEKYMESLKLNLKNRMIDQKVKWVGQIKNDHKFKLMAQHDLLVLTSYNENFANVVIESLSVGTPVLLSDQVGLAHYVEINELGWITTLDIDSIANKIKEAYIDNEKQAKIRDTAADIISKDFNTKNLTSQYLSLYNSIL